MSSQKKDLIVLVADSNMESTIRGLLSRTEALQIKSLTFDVFPHMYRDPGCLNGCEDFLRPQISRFQYGLVIFDYHGCGKENEKISKLESDLRDRLARSGWDNRAEVIIINPELEIWIWSDSPHVARCLGWKGGQNDLRLFLNDEKIWPSDLKKPPDPKEAMKAVLRITRKPRSSSIFRQLAETVSLSRCEDKSFIRFKSILKEWFFEEV